MPLSKQKHIGATWRGLILLMALLSLTGTVTYYALSDAYRKLIEHQAQTVAEIVARQAAIARTVYAEHAAAQHHADAADAADAQQRPHVPASQMLLPAQFLKLMAQATRASGDGLYSFRPISKWHIEPTQGLQDDFQKWAWSELERQDQADPAGPLAWQSVGRFEQYEGVNTFRYMRADPATSSACVACHNAYEQRPEVMARRVADGVAPGKVWQQHQLMGAIEVNIPLDEVEVITADQTRRVLLIMLSVLGLTVMLMAWFLYRNVACFRSVTRLSWIATHDAMTGILNRHGFNHRLEDLLDATRYSNAVHVLAYLDLDHLKAVNDTYGHAAGDHVLVRLAAILRDELRSEDVVARFGGDEFAIVMVSCKMAQGRLIAQKICDRVAAEEFVFDQNSVHVGVSIGLVELNPVSVDAGQFRQHADQALYAAKHAGRSHVVSYPLDGFDAADHGWKRS